MREHIRNGLFGLLGFWITTFFMEWFVHHGWGMPGGYVLRVWNFVDFFVPGSWMALAWINNYRWLAMLLDYLMEGAVAFCSVFMLSWMYSRIQEAWAENGWIVRIAFFIVKSAVRRIGKDD